MRHIQPRSLIIGGLDALAHIVARARHVDLVYAAGILYADLEHELRVWHVVDLWSDPGIIQEVAGLRHVMLVVFHIEACQRRRILHI